MTKKRLNVWSIYIIYENQICQSIFNFNIILKGIKFDGESFLKWRRDQIFLNVCRGGLPS
ncbi:hypothetical protein EG344_03355 [Chryseobacterium sp. G0162]|nr:hypothetical protein EG344_03355 [Chryseobacterium sp. G0162]